MSRELELIPAPTSSSGVNAGSPCLITAAFAVVPPISKAMTWGRSRSRASWAALITPAVGPDSRTNAGRWAAVAAGITPPLDCNIKSAASVFRDRSAVSRRWRYAPTTGCRNALMTVVLVRSYSPISGRMSALSEMATSGIFFLTTSAMDFSC